MLRYIAPDNIYYPKGFDHLFQCIIVFQLEARQYQSERKLSTLLQRTTNNRDHLTVDSQGELNF